MSTVWQDDPQSARYRFGYVGGTFYGNEIIVAVNDERGNGEALELGASIVIA